MALDDVLVVGAGGHARVCIEALVDGGHRVAGCLTADGRPQADLPVRVLGRDVDLEELVAGGLRSVFVAVGDNRDRLRLLEQSRRAGARLVSAVSTHAVVAASACLGEAVAVMPGAVVNAGAVLADGVIVNTNASVDHDGDLGRCVHVAPGCAVAGHVTVGEGSLLGIGSSVMPGRRIGRWVTVGAGAAVVDDLPDGVVAVGVPARPRPR